MSVLDRDALEASTLADLHAIASELSIDGYRRLRKADLIDTILAKQSGGEAPSKSDDADEGEGEGSGGSSRRRRGRRGGRGRSGSGRDDADEGDSDADSDSDEEDEDEAPARSSRSSRPRRGDAQDGGAKGTRERGPRDRGGRGGERESRGSERENRSGERESRGGERESREEEPVTVEGVVELLPNGSGFARVSPPDPSDDDVYISAAQVKRCELVNGDRVSGPRRAPHRSERFPSLVRIDTVNGRPAEEIADRGRFDDLPAEFPSARFELGSDDATLKAVEFLTPFGRGSRVTISGGTFAGKSHLLRALATTLAAKDDVSVFVALAGIRPEELTEWGDAEVKPSAAVTFAASAEAQDNAVELVVDQARRLAARGSDAIVLIDTLDGLHPLSARRALAAARKLKDGGSLTVIATSSKPLGGETTVISLDATLAVTGRYPALDLPASGTLRAELLVGSTGAKAIAKERAKAVK